MPRDKPPDLFEAIKGTAHLYDLYASKSQGEDPQLRNKLGKMSDVSVEEALHVVNDIAVAGVDPTETTPTMSIEDTDGGIRVTLEVSDTPIEPGDFEVTEQEPVGVGITAGDWETSIDIDDEYDVTDWEITEQPGMAIIDIAVSDDEPPTDELTIRQFFETNPEIEDMLRDERGDEAVGLLLDSFGDKPASALDDLLE